MAFGKVANAPATNNTPNTNGDVRPVVFLPLTEGTRIFRLIGNEVKFKEWWIAKEADGTWVPKGAYNPSDKRECKPVITQVYDPDAETWRHDGETRWDNPIDRYLDSLELSKEERRKWYPKEKFVFNVLDLTRVKILPNGQVIYPNLDMQYPGAPDDVKARPHGKVLLLKGSSSDVNRPEPETTTVKKAGKKAGAGTLYKRMYNTLRAARNEEGDPIGPFDFDWRIQTDEDYDYQISVGQIRAMPVEFDVSKVYDLSTWPNIFPNAALDALFRGEAEWKDVITQYKIVQYPELIANPYTDETEATF